MTQAVHDTARTKANKIRQLEKELRSNPNNASAKKALEFWKTHERKARKGRR